MDIILHRRIIHSYQNCKGRVIGINIQKFFEYLFHYIRQQSRGVSVEQLLLMWVICIAILHIGCILYTGFSGRKVKEYKEVLLILILGYACFGAQITLFRREPGSRGVMYTFLHFGNLFGNWYERQQFFYAFLNVCFFIPWGFLLGLWRWEDKVWKRLFTVTEYSFLTTASIEIIQLVTGRGFFEVTDLVTNLIGGVIGGILACIITGIVRRIQKEG